jgi:hypothetical protein
VERIAAPCPECREKGCSTRTGRANRISARTPRTYFIGGCARFMPSAPARVAVPAGAASARELGPPAAQCRCPRWAGCRSAPGRSGCGRGCRRCGSRASASARGRFRCGCGRRGCRARLPLGAGPVGMRTRMPPVRVDGVGFGAGVTAGAVRLRARRPRAGWDADADAAVAGGRRRLRRGERGRLHRGAGPVADQRRSGRDAGPTHQILPGLFV